MNLPKYHAKKLFTTISIHTFSENCMADILVLYQIVMFENKDKSKFCKYYCNITICETDFLGKRGEGLKSIMNYFISVTLIHITKCIFNQYFKATAYLFLKLLHENVALKVHTSCQENISTDIYLKYANLYYSLNIIFIMINGMINMNI